MNALSFDTSRRARAQAQAHARIADPGMRRRTIRRRWMLACITVCVTLGGCGVVCGGGGGSGSGFAGGCATGLRF